MSGVLAQKARLELAEQIVRPSARTARLLERVVFSCLLALVALTALPYGTVDLWWEALFECIVFALAGIWIIEGWLSGAWLVREHRLLVPLLALVVFAFIQTLPVSGTSASTPRIEGSAWWAISADPFQTRLCAFKLLALTVTGGLLLRYTSNEWRLRALIYLVVGIAVGSALFAIVRQATRPEMYDSLLPNLFGAGYGQFMNRNHFAFLMEMGLGLVLGLIVGGVVRRDRLLIYLSAALPLWTALVLSNSRGGIFSMLCQLLFLALLFSAAQNQQEASPWRSNTVGLLWRISRLFVVRIALIACLMIVATVGVVWMGGDPLVSRLESVPGELSAEGDEARDNARRVEIWRATWQLIKAYPIAGIGFGGYWIAISEYHDASGAYTPNEAHNDYLEFIASGGAIGAALGVWFIIAFTKRVRERLRSTDPFLRAACFGALAGIFAVAVHSFFDYGLHITVNALVFIILIVIATVNGRVEGKS